MSKLCTIEVISEIFPHPNADKLEFAKVLGYSCIVPKDRYQVGDKIIMIQPDSVLPEASWSEFYRKFSKNRVKAMKLRGEWSFGIVENIALLEGKTSDLEPGTEISDLMGIVKYEPILPNDVQIIGKMPFGIPVTDEERYQNLEMEAYLGKMVDITLKIDGQSCTAYYKDGQYGICGRQYELDRGIENYYTAHTDRYDLENKLRAYCEEHKVNLAIRGESYGRGIQTSKTNLYSQIPRGLAVFGVYLIDERRYPLKGEAHYFTHVCEKLGLETVPFLEKNVELTMDLIKKYDEELTELNGKSFEGVVIVGVGFSFKVINKHYDSLK